MVAVDRRLGQNVTTGTPEQISRPLGKAHLVHLTEVLVSTHGVLYVHSATPAVTPHVEWAVAGVLSTPVRFDWTAQPVSPGSLRAEVTWLGDSGCGGRLPSSGCDGERYAFTPGLGLFHAMTSANGDLMVPENRLRQLLTAHLVATDDVASDLRTLLGEQWDDELEPFRHAGEGTPVRWLHQVV